jgi:hypothetical protein
VPQIIRRLPIRGEATRISFDGNQVEISPHRAIVWVSISTKGLPRSPATARRFPAVLDKGFNGGFAIRQEQVDAWSGTAVSMLPLFHAGKTHRGISDWRAANIWLYPNVPGSFDFAHSPPIQLELDRGIQVFRSPGPGAYDSRPQLPLVGLRALSYNRICVLFDGALCCVDAWHGLSFGPQIWLRSIVNAFQSERLSL